MKKLNKKINTVKNNVEAYASSCSCSVPCRCFCGVSALRAITSGSSMIRGMRRALSPYRRR